MRLFLTILFFISLFKLLKKSSNTKGIEKNNNEYISISNKFEVIHKLRQFKPVSFEYFITNLYELSGYTIIRKPLYGKGYKSVKDGGIDIICEKGGVKYYIQVKKKYGEQCPVSVIREMKGTLKEGIGIIITTSIFSTDAKKEKDNLILIDYNGILNMIDKLDDEGKKVLEEKLNDKRNFDNFYVKPKTCKLCGAPMQKIKKGKVSFYGCMNYYSKGNEQCSNTSNYYE